MGGPKFRCWTIRGGHFADAGIRFATHQTGVPALAKDFLPACIDHAAMPVRVENGE